METYIYGSLFLSRVSTSKMFLRVTLIKYIKWKHLNQINFMTNLYKDFTFCHLWMPDVPDYREHPNSISADVLNYFRNNYAVPSSTRTGTSSDGTGTDPSAHPGSSPARVLLPSRPSGGGCLCSCRVVHQTGLRRRDLQEPREHSAGGRYPVLRLQSYPLGRGIQQLIFWLWILV